MADKAREGHSILVRAHSMSDERLVVVCTCGDLYADPEYSENGDGGRDMYAVPLSVLMDIAEAHFAEVDRFSD